MTPLICYHSEPLFPKPVSWFGLFLLFLTANRLYYCCCFEIPPGPTIIVASVQASFTGCAENGGRSFFNLPNMAWESIIATDIYLTTMLHLFKVTKDKVEKILKGSLDSIPSPSPSVKIQIIGGKFCLGCKGKTLLGVVNKLFIFKSLLRTPSHVLPLHLKQTFPPII